jgi:Rrf2 family transcriptional regulator, cysteine metabolism repressor
LIRRASMPLLSRKVDYALLILSHLDTHTSGASARELASRFGLSRPFIANILKVLCHKGFVASHRGVKGGYALQRPMDAVSLAELMDALDDGFRLTECTDSLPGEACNVMALCPLRHAIGAVHERLRDVLRNVMLADLFRPCHTTETGSVELLPVTAERLFAVN